MLTLYPARSIITMNDSMPRASAVLVRDGIILEVGERKNMQPWLEGQEYQVDEQFADKVICPGFIDPHLHPSMAAVLLPMEFITAMRWKLPCGRLAPTRISAADCTNGANKQALQPWVIQCSKASRPLWFGAALSSRCRRNWRTGRRCLAWRWTR